MKPLIEAIHDAVESLANTQQAYVILKRFGLSEGDEKPMTLQEIGDTYNVSRQWVSFIEQEALSRLRHRCRADILECYIRYRKEVR